MCVCAWVCVAWMVGLRVSVAGILLCVACVSCTQWLLRLVSLLVSPAITEHSDYLWRITLGATMPITFLYYWLNNLCAVMT